MVRWHEDEAQLSRQRRAFAVGGVQGDGRRGVNRRNGKEPDQGNAGGGGGVLDRRRYVLDLMHGRSRMTTARRIPTMPGQSMSGVHRPGRHCLHQKREAP